MSSLLRLFLVACLPTLTSSAQLSGINRFEFQAGNTPYTSPSDMTTGFNQLSLRYHAGALRASFRVEQFMTAMREREYTALSQYRVTYRKDGVKLQVGHFYDILGRGLLLRAFEIPGAILEDAASRVRQSFRRDIKGFSASFEKGGYGVKLVRGRPLVNVLPPTLPEADRRPDLIEALSGKLRLGQGRIEGSYLRNSTATGASDYAALSADWLLPGGLSAYAEYAQQAGGGQEALAFGDEGRFALYSSLAWSKPGAGATVEYKRYQEFFLGSGYNDPPSLIREHSYVVLNRSTHILNVINESGFQAEGYYRVPEIGVLTVNATRAKNTFGEDFVFTEYFAELSVAQVLGMSARVFLDLAQDPFRFESDRVSGGAYLDRLLSKGWSLSLDLEVQSFQRTILETEQVQNYVIGVAVSKSTKYSAGLAFERTTDDFLTDDPRSIPVETTPRNWLGLNLGYRPNRSHSMTLFLGTRRGGPACTSGICYEVLDFEGAEFRLISRL